MKKLIGVFSVILFLAILFRFQIGDLLLDGFGECGKAEITEELRSVKYVKPTYLYSFKIDDKQYDGNSKIEKGQRKNNEICILFLPLFPSINRPLNDNKSHIACNCNN